MAIANPHFPEIEAMTKKKTGKRKVLKMCRKHRCAKSWGCAENGGVAVDVENIKLINVFSI